MGFKQSAMAALHKLKAAGHRVIKLAIYDKTGKHISWRKIGIGAAIAGVGAGIYIYRRHKKHGHVVHPTPAKLRANKKKLLA